MGGIFRVTVERCIACGKCELACAFSHGQAGLPGIPRIHVVRRGVEQGIPLTCLQCHEAACAALCPTNALVRDQQTGAIRVLEERCIRCAVCVAACPFGNLAWDGFAQRPAKCDLCGGEPRCVPFCPTRALEFLPEASAREGAGDRAAAREEVAAG